MKRRAERIAVLVFFIFFMLFAGLAKADTAKAAIDYEKGKFSITVDASKGGKYLYYYLISTGSEAKAKKKLDALPGAKWDRVTYSNSTVNGEAKKTAVFDLSTMVKPKGAFLAYKFSQDEKEYKLVQIEKQIQNLKVDYAAEKLFDQLNRNPAEETVTKGALNFTLGKKKTGIKVDFNCIQMRKGTAQWVSLSAINAHDLADLHVKGATVYFRIAANQSYDSSAKSYWPSKEIKFKFAKSANAPAVSVNGSKVALGLKKGMEYSMDGEKWINAVKAHGDSSGKLPSMVSVFKLYKDYDETEKSGTISNISTDLLGVTPVSIFVRKAASGKKPISKLRECTLTHAAELKAEELPKIEYQLNYSSAGGLKVSNHVDREMEVAVVDWSKVFVTGCSLAGGGLVSFESITLDNETKDVIAVPLKKETPAVKATGQAINGECVDLIATKGDNFIPWVSIGKGSTDKPKVVKIENKKYSSIPIEKRIILARYKSVPKTKTEAMKIASDIAILEMPTTIKQTLTATVSGSSNPTKAAVSVSSGANSVKSFTVELTAQKMNAEYVTPTVSWVTESGSSASKPAGVTTTCTSANRIHTTSGSTSGSGRVVFKITKKTPEGTYFVKLKAESAETMIRVEIANGNPIISLSSTNVTVAQNDSTSVDIRVTGITSYSAIQYSLYSGNVVSGTALPLTGVYHAVNGWSSLDAPSVGVQGSITIDSDRLPSGHSTYCLEIKATNTENGCSSLATLVIRKTAAAASVMSLRLPDAKAGVPAEEIGEDPAASQPRIKATVDYINEEVHLDIPEKSKLYVSTDKKEKDWDRLENLIVSGTGLYTKFDISSVLSSKSTTIAFRTKMDEPSTKVELQGLSAIKVKASGASLVVTGIPAGRVVEYRKGTSSNWVEVKESTSPQAITDYDREMGASTEPVNPVAIVSSGQTEVNFNCYTLRGATITFRLKATESLRVGKEAKGKVAKKAKGPNIKVDGGKLSFSGVKADASEYRLDDKSGYVTIKDKFLRIGDLFGTVGNPSIPEGFVSMAGISAAVHGGTVEIRNAAKGNKPASCSKIVEVTNQAILTTGSNITVAGMQKTKGKETVSLPSITISDASSANPYEYTLIDTSAKEFDITKQKWVQIKSGKQTQIKKVGSIEPGNGKSLLIRKKSYVDKTTKKVVLASTCLQYNYLSSTSGYWAGQQPPSSTPTN